MTLPARLAACSTRRGASREALRAAEMGLGLSFPPDYEALLLETDGLEGFVIGDAYVMFWSVSELVDLNAGYAVAEFVPGVVLVGTNGGDTGVEFRRVDGHVEYVAVPLVGRGPDAVSPLGPTLETWLAQLELDARDGVCA